MSDEAHRRVLPITGYMDRLSARPGESLDVKVSAIGVGEYEAEVLRIVSADPNPDGPGLIYKPCDFGLVRRHLARRQEIDIGSYAVAPAHPLLTGEALLISLLVQPWLLREAPSSLAGAVDEEGKGWRLEIDKGGLSFSYRGADGEEVRSILPMKMKRRHWYRIWAGYDCAAGRLLVGAQSLKGGTAMARDESVTLSPLPEGAPLILAARLAGGRSEGHFNGRLEDPALHADLPAGDAEPPEPQDAPAEALLAWWDFSEAIESQAIVDRGPLGLGGRLVNVPTRAVCGARWDGSVMHWREAPRDYAAIHFHEDDLHDCGWETDFTLEIPQDTPSGVYGVRLSQAGAEDIVPFYVLPPRRKSGERPRAHVCFLASSFTYQVYANHARGNCDEDMRTRMAEWGASPFNPDDFPIYGRSTYNFHPDGSGNSFASRLRPMLTVRPGFLTFVDQAGSGLRHFSADTHLLTWLESRGIDFDVVTDEDLDDEGLDLISGYRTVLTGSHPEYHTVGTLDALEAYTAAGGKLVYLGGNGFYWKVARSRELPGGIEVRRGEGGIRAWAADPGEYYHQLDGAYGGLWRRNGRPPQRLVGVGFSSQGLFEGSYYRRLPASEGRDVAWIFEGVEEERIGDYGLSGGGAAGFELDRADVELGTPDNAIVLARSEGHSGSFVVVPEELLSHLHTVSGEKLPDLIRSELVYFERTGGGAVFSVGSITFCGSLNQNKGRNGVSRLLENVVRRFAEL